MNYYKILGVSRLATRAEIKSAYKNLVNEHKEKLKIIKEAYSILSNPLKRDKYDLDLVTEQSSPTLKNKKIKKNLHSVGLAGYLLIVTVILLLGPFKNINNPLPIALALCCFFAIYYINIYLFLKK